MLWHPLSEVTVNITLYGPRPVNICEGVCMEDVFAVPEEGSPKFQLHPVIVPGVTEDASVKVVTFPKHTGKEMKFATGSGFTNAFSETVSLQPEEFVTIKVTVNEPEVP